MDVPPVYTTTAGPPEYPASSNDPPPSYTFPQTFNIGSTRTSAPLVSSAQVKGHLVLLRAFAKLREQVDLLDAGVREEIPGMPDDKERRWAWFVGMGVERFSLWCGSLSYRDVSRAAEDFLPPLDVLMVWHAYMLNPGWYAEDCARIPALRHLAQVTPTFSSSLSSATLDTLLVSDPTQARLDAWTAHTNRLWDPLADAARHPTRTIPCPKCRRPIEIPYMTPEGTGFLQHDFQTQCSYPSCAGVVPPITKAVLGVRKMAEDLAREDLAREDAGAGAGADACWWTLAGTLRTPQTASDLARAKLVKDAILSRPVSNLKFRKPEGAGQEAWVLSIMERNAYSAPGMRAAMAGRMRGGGGNLIKRIWSAYADGELFSVDLVGAVIRQGSFVKKMHDLQWTQPGFFDTKEDEVALQHAIARYHAFLDLMAASPVSFYVPTLDIDLAWHTHQLLGETYHAECMRYVGRYIDHDDKVEENALATAFDVTCRAWSDRFGLRYTHCGCPLPGQTIGQRLSRLVSLSGSREGGRGRGTEGLSYLVPPLREDLRAGTHPSDHNAVFLVGGGRRGQAHAGEKMRERRREKFRRRVEREREEAAKRHGKGKGKGKGKGGGDDAGGEEEGR